MQRSTWASGRSVSAVLESTGARLTICDDDPLALQRLVSNAGRAVLVDHWNGDRSELSDLNLQGALAAAAFFLPRRIRRRLRVIGRT